MKTMTSEKEVIQEIVVMNILRRRNIRNVLHARIKDRAAEEGMSRVLYFHLVVDGTHRPDHGFMCMENAMDNERVVEWTMRFDNEPLYFSAQRYLVLDRDDVRERLQRDDTQRQQQQQLESLTDPV
ncbi:hypothetical protein BpHYR1_031454 [Brachionus plicatilis]|uniref:Uncharacterized protein n=1 Tax=Brachionus plicatilis TaxID=10195 RepID=A0A3M7PC97_BRAPC|nr:hypothetical protein BpHYR1_031454 [Brachionus plicatilis]